MSLQWYPGHMVKARRQMAEAMPVQDMLIEVIDARVPGASSNPLVTELRRDKPCLKVLAKADLADPDITKAWLQYFEATGKGRVLAVAITTSKSAEARNKVTELCAKLVPHRVNRPRRAMIVGVPNVGKSTLINTLASRSIAKVGDKPAVTKAQQQVVLKNGTVLKDNPGVMWPKIEDENAAYRLAFAGSIPDTALYYEPLGRFGAAFLLKHHPAALLARYNLGDLPPTPDDLLEAIGRRRGALKAGGVIDFQKACEALVHDFRSGALGRISLEKPPSFAAKDSTPKSVPSDHE